MGKRVFISKNASEVESLNTYLESKESTLIAHSFLHYSPLFTDLSEEYDIIFFGSPRSVLFFKDQFEIPTAAAIACVGRKTAESIKALGITIAFSGDKQGNIHEVAQSFKTWCGDRKVLFPISSRSLKTFSSLFEKNQKIELPIYDTISIEHEIETCDIYIFTSPSNFEGFTKMNEIPQHAEVIAWGESTKKAIEHTGTSVNRVLEEPSIEKLLEILS